MTTTPATRTSIDESVIDRQRRSTAYVHVGAHVEPGTTVSYHLYPDEDRITLAVGDDPAEVTLFLKTAAITRVIDTLRRAAAELTSTK